MPRRWSSPIGPSESIPKRHHRPTSGASQDSGTNPHLFYEDLHSGETFISLQYNAQTLTIDFFQINDTLGSKTFIFLIFFDWKSFDKGRLIFWSTPPKINKQTIMYYFQFTFTLNWLDFFSNRNNRDLFMVIFPDLGPRRQRNRRSRGKPKLPCQTNDRRNHRDHQRSPITAPPTMPTTFSLPIWVTRWRVWRPRRPSMRCWRWVQVRC